MSDMKGVDLIRKVNALLRYHFKINPDELTDDEWCERYQELKWVLKFEFKRLGPENKSVDL
jgi:hypothetical protein